MSELFYVMMRWPCLWSLSHVSLLLCLAAYQAWHTLFLQPIWNCLYKELLDHYYSAFVDRHL